MKNLTVRWPVALFSVIVFVASGCAGLLERRPASETHGSGTGSRPNVVLIYTDDLGYSDVGFQSQMPTPTPAIQGLASTGLHFKNFYSASSICSPARASLLSGKFPPETGVGKALFPGQGHGVLRPEETTLGELFLQSGYQTGFFGKWHVGDLAGTRPLDQGFQRFTGILHSHDLTRTLFRQDQVADGRASTEKILQSILTDAVSFISERREAPFFIMYSTPMPHVPLPKGYSYQRTLFQIDQDVARIVEALERAGVRENTLIIFASDNGPWIPKGDSAGESWPHRGTKGSHLEGGFKVPMVASWPARHRGSQVVEDIVSGTDFFATFGEMLGVPAATANLGESRSFWARVSGDAAAPSRVHMPFYFGNRLEALRAGRWKYDYGSSRLYDLGRDPAEARDVSSDNQDVVQHFASRDLERIRQKLGMTAPSSSSTIELLRPEDSTQSTFYQQSIPQHGIYFSPVGSHNLARVEALAYEGDSEVVAKFLEAGLDVNRVFERFSQAVGATGGSGEFNANIAALWGLSGQIEKLRLARGRGVAVDLRVKTRPFKHSRKTSLVEHLESEIDAWTQYERLSDMKHRDYFSRHLERLREARSLVQSR